jgi:AraC family transcriptional regulator
MMPVSIETLKPMRVAAIRHRGPYHEIGAAFGKLGGWAASRGVFQSGGRMLGVYYNSPRDTLPEDLVSDACVEVSDAIQPDPAAGVSIMTVPGGRFAVGMLKGPYEGLPTAWPWLIEQWIPTHNCRTDFRPDRPCFEIYLNSPMDTPPSDLLTAIHVPVL